MADDAGNCRSCGELLTQRFCAKCGTDSQCASCGATLTGSFCGQCGTAAFGGAGTGVVVAGTTQRPTWLVPVAIMAVVAILGVAAVVGVVATKGSSSSNETAAIRTPESSTTLVTTTTTAALTTTILPTAVPVVCQADATTLKAQLSKSGTISASTMSHMALGPDPVKYTMGNKYVYFHVVPIDQMGSQGGGVFMRCDAGVWTFLTIVDGYSCNSKWIGDDLAAAKIFGVC